MKKAMCLLLLVLTALSAASAETTEKVQELPPLLLFTQRQTAREFVNKTYFTQRMYPETANAGVNAEMEALIDEMYTRALPFSPETHKNQTDPSYLTVGANITRTGQKWLSFLTTARIDHQRRQTYVDFDARVYDMESGKRLTLGDIFAQDSPAWALLADEVRAQLNAYFLGTEPDAAALETLCSREGLEKAAFTLTPAALRLHYRADALYPGREQLMQVKIFYNVLRGMMTPEAREQTDNSMYKMVALTFDDGVAHYSTAAVADGMRAEGAAVTFFVVGYTISGNQDMLAANHDAGHLIASHNYEHTTENLTPANIKKWKEKYDAALNEAIGVRPSMVRAPGGKDVPFANAKAGLPVIHWSLSPSDAGNDNVSQIIYCVSNSTHDGDVVLMHDLNPRSREYAPEIVRRLTAKGFLCVPVDELYAAHGIMLEPDQVYLGRDDVVRP